MVEQHAVLDQVFSSLADSTRRDILYRLTSREMDITEIASAYDMSFAAVAKHLKVLEKSELITKRREGRQQIIQIDAKRMEDAAVYIAQYKKLWNERFDRLETILNEEK